MATLRKSPRSAPLRVRAAMTFTAIVALAGGCASGGPGTSVPDAGGASAPGDQQTSYSCDQVQVPTSVLADGRTADTLGEHGQAALAGMEVPEIEPAEWLVVEEQPEYVALVRELDEPEENGPGDIRTHEHLAIEWVEDAPNVQPPDWVLMSHNTCALRTTTAGAADLTLDPDHPLDPESREVHLLVTERACASGEIAEGRVRLATLTEGGDTVDVAIGVKPLSGGADCPSNPPTAFVVELDDLLGERTVRDVAVYPARELTAPRGTQ